jgi:signal transduction histidine kinase
MTFTPQHVELSVEDDGIGSDKLQNGFGLTAMRDRIAALQGTLQVSSRLGDGTSVICRIPVTAP